MSEAVFWVQTSSGEEGFVDINLSVSNVSDILRDNSKFEDSFLTTDLVCINPKMTQ
jgi:hypothetical protein